MKRILYLTFYYEPDLCAGSFRNSPLVKELSRQAGDNTSITVITTMPNRYHTFKASAPQHEQIGNLTIHRIQLPEHKSGFTDQIRSFFTYYRSVISITRKEQYDLVIASSSRLFTAYLGYRIARKKRTPLYLDIRDIFYDTMKDVVKNKMFRMGLLPILKYIEGRVFNNADHINLISGGFRTYFNKYTSPAYTYFSNGIDDEFIDIGSRDDSEKRNIRKIIYAGNIGEGQGLHTIIPQAAQLLSAGYSFQIIGDGGARHLLEAEIEKHHLVNVEMLNPVKRAELIRLYLEADFLFLHLNDYDAFKKVLPSKIFELAAFDLPIIAGVDGFAREFIETNVANSILFKPGNATELAARLKEYQYKREKRTTFIEKFKRSNINTSMAQSMLQYL